MSTVLSSVAGIALIYTALIFFIAWYAHRCKENGRSIISNPVIYTLSLGVYCTSWTYYGSVGKAATTGIDFLLIYLGPSLIAFSWLFLLRRIVRISKEHNITSIADFLSQRYGKSPWLGALVTLIAFLGIMPYIALQLKAVSTSFFILSGVQTNPSTVISGTTIPTGLILALILSLFSIIFGARKLVSSERHEGLIAAIAFESMFKLVALLVVGIFVTYTLFDGFTDIFERFKNINPEKFAQLFTFNTIKSDPNYTSTFTLLFLSMGAIILLPRQFHVMVIENSDERHILTAMWLFPTYLFLINLFVMPIAIGGILTTGSSIDADFFVLSLPQQAGYHTIAMLAFLGGLSAAAGMVMIESIAISTMLLNHIFMPVILRYPPREWFPTLLINLKRFGIVLVVFLGYFYYWIIGDSYTLVNMGLISFSAAAQFMPAMLGALYWKRGNKAGAISGIMLGFLIWLYTLLLPSFIKSGWFSESLLSNGPFGIELFKPTELFGLTGMDLWSHSLFWSMLFNVGSYIICSILFRQNEQERDQVHKFISIFGVVETQHRTERKRLSKPVTTEQFVTLMSKFIGELESRRALKIYLTGRNIGDNAKISEFELPDLKRFTEKTLSGSVGGAAARAIVNNFLSDIGSSMEPVYDIFSSIRTNLDQNRESLFVRLKASEIINRTLDMQVIMDDLLRLLVKEFKLDVAVIQKKNDVGAFINSSVQGESLPPSDAPGCYLENLQLLDQVYTEQKARFINDLRIENSQTFGLIASEGFVSCAHIPIFREGEPVIAVLSLYSKSIAGLFTKEFIDLLSSLAGQLAQAITIVQEIEAKQLERSQKEAVLLKSAKITRDMEIAQQIQASFLPESAPIIAGADIAGRCVSAAHVGGDYYDFFLRDDHIIDIVMADVSGHSVGAALIMSEVRTLLRAEANNKARTPNDILENLNIQLFDDLTRAELFITMFYATYNAEDGLLRYSNAGHNHPVLMRADEACLIELDAEGLILGVKDDVLFEEQNVTLKSGDLLLFYTDGLTEASNIEGAMFGTTGLHNHLKTCLNLSANEIINSFYDKIHDFTGSHNLQDDISLVVVKIL